MGGRLGFRVRGERFDPPGWGFRVSGSGWMFQSPRVAVLGFRLWGLGLSGSRGLEVFGPVFRPGRAGMDL